MKKLLLILSIILIAGYIAEITAQTYVGSQSCQGCHTNQIGSVKGVYNDWAKSGHPYKLQKIQNGMPPAYPAGLTSQKSVGPNVNYTIQPGVPKPPRGYETWSQIGWVMGGYHSNARFLDSEGYIIIGDSTRYHIPTNRWVRYNQAEPGRTMYNYSCYRCHTTGPSTEKTPEFMPYPGIQGSWAEAGVGCEACHGPASGHLGNPSGIKPPKEGLNTCNNCHARDRGEQFAWNLRVEWQPRTVQGTPTGFIRHREQGDMMYASKHGQEGMTCATCHDPHKGVYYEQLGGIKETPSCQSCHPNKNIPGHGPELASCTDCHMPFAALNADALAPYVSEQSAHYWGIETSAKTMFENIDTIGGNFFIKMEEGISKLTLDYTCLQCHVTRDVNWASGYASNIHQVGVNVDKNETVPSGYLLAQNYPNPFNPSTVINFSLPEANNVTLNVYSITGEFIKTLVNDFMQSGFHTFSFNAEGLPSGVYIYKITAGNYSSAKKMVLIQ